MEAYLKSGLRKNPAINTNALIDILGLGIFSWCLIYLREILGVDKYHICTYPVLGMQGFNPKNNENNFTVFTDTREHKAMVGLNVIMTRYTFVISSNTDIASFILFLCPRTLVLQCE